MIRGGSNEMGLLDLEIYDERQGSPARLPGDGPSGRRWEVIAGAKGATPADRRGSLTGAAERSGLRLVKPEVSQAPVAVPVVAPAGGWLRSGAQSAAMRWAVVVSGGVAAIAKLVVKARLPL